MAFSSEGQFNTNVTENIVWDGNIFAMHSSPKYSIGQRLVRGDKIYRYSHFGDDTSRGEIVAQDFSESGVVDTDNGIIASASAVTTTDGLIGQKFMQITLASVSAQQYAGGSFHTTDDAGEGYTYQIKGNTVTGDPATGDIRVELFDNLQVAVTVATDFAITGNMYANLEVATAATDICISGVAVSEMDVSEADYGWIQTWGPCTVLQDGSTTEPAIGDQVSLSDGVAGAFQILGGGATENITDGLAEAIVGYCLIAGDDGGHGAVYLQIGA